MKQAANFKPFMNSYRESEGHILIPGLAIGSLALVLAAGFGFVGIMDRANEGIAGLIQIGGGTAKSLPEWAVWLAASVGAFGLSFLVLSVPGAWRRIVLWVSALILIAGWGPVLVLADRSPVVAVPLLATFWAGLCSLVYASRHRMAADQ
jgi:hypothetical protein